MAHNISQHNNDSKFSHTENYPNKPAVRMPEPVSFAQDSVAHVVFPDEATSKLALAPEALHEGGGQASLPLQK